MTDFLTKCSILSELWLNYRDSENFTEFIDYCDLGFPLAYAIANGIVEKSDKAENLIVETWDLFIKMIGIPDDKYETLDSMLVLGFDDDIE